MSADSNILGSLLATRMVGPAQPCTLVVFGAGKQIEAHIDLHLAAFPSIMICIIVNRTINHRVLALFARLRPRYTDSEIRFSAITPTGEIFGTTGDHNLTFKESVHSADIICTATSSTAALFPSDWVRNGTHINLIGSFAPDMCEVDSDLIHRASRVVVDSRDACSIEAGELIKAGVDKHNMLELGQIVTIAEDGEILSNRDEIASAREGDVTIFKSVGVGLQDVAIATAVVTRAESLQVGTRIDSYDVL
jgi:ornithine cyclodeaminase/alanine dehydrogenase-like protein (mu-crystallin family)